MRLVTAESQIFRAISEKLFDSTVRRCEVVNVRQFDRCSGVLQVVAPDGRHLYSRPLGVSYDDGSNCVWIGTLKHSVGQLVSSNKIIYPDAFQNFRGDLVCTYRRGGFESDLIFRTKPAPPETFGLAAESSTIQLFTEFFNTQDPQQIPSVEDEWYGLQDHTLKFGKLTMGHGKAFELGAQPTVGGAGVYKCATKLIVRPNFWKSG